MRYLYCEETGMRTHAARRKEFEMKSGDDPNIDLSYWLQCRQKSRIVGTSLVVEIIGALYGDGVGSNELYGGTNYQSIVNEVKAASGNIDEIIFVFDSPGGEVRGCHETAEFIKSLSISTVAYVKGQCCSAAYYLASACNQIIASDTAIIGSIGCVMTLWNMRDESFLTVTNDDASFKSPDKPLNSEALHYYRDLCNKIAGRFQAFLSESRTNLLTEAFCGKVYVVEDALCLGLIDSVLPWTDFPSAN